jgi:uncharacterized protein YggE
MKPQTPLAMALAAGTLLVAPALAQTVPPAMISVTGEATISVPPDLAQIDGGVTWEAKTARDAIEANNAAMGKVLLALKGAGIEERDYQTSRLSLQPQCAPNRAGSSPIVGYHASNRVTVRVRDVAKVGNVIDTLVGAGANDIGGINFTVSQSSKLLDDARAQAITDAAARPRSMPKPPASRWARRSASPRRVRPARRRFANCRAPWPRPRRSHRAKRRLRSR